MHVQFLMKNPWYKFAKATERKWGAPIELQMAIIRKESGYDWLARPERTKLFKVIPWKRKSSSLGYSQAIENTWETYKKVLAKSTLLGCYSKTHLILLAGMLIKLIEK